MKCRPHADAELGVNEIEEDDEEGLIPILPSSPICDRLFADCRPAAVAAVAHHVTPGPVCESDREWFIRTAFTALAWHADSSYRVLS